MKRVAIDHWQRVIMHGSHSSERKSTASDHGACEWQASRKSAGHEKRRKNGTDRHANHEREKERDRAFATEAVGDVSK